MIDLRRSTGCLQSPSLPFWDAFSIRGSGSDDPRRTNAGMRTCRALSVFLLSAPSSPALAYGGMFALATFVHPDQREMTVRIPASQAQAAMRQTGEFAHRRPLRHRPPAPFDHASSHRKFSGNDERRARRGRQHASILCAATLPTMPRSWRRRAATLSAPGRTRSATMCKAWRKPAWPPRPRRGICPRIRQFHRFLFAEGLRGDDPTGPVAGAQSRPAAAQGHERSTKSTG